MTEINKEQITVIEQYNKLKARYSWQTSKFLWMKDAGYIHAYSVIDKWENALRTEKDWSTKNLYETQPTKGLYFKPHLDIYMSSGRKETKYFQTLKELIEWREKNLEGLNLIEI